MELYLILRLMNLWAYVYIYLPDYEDGTITDLKGRLQSG